MQQYKSALVTYIDILGFRDLVNETKTNPTKAQKLAELLATVKDELSVPGRAIPIPEGRKQKPLFESFSFSDLTVRCTFMPDGSDVGEFINWELFFLGEKQLGLAFENILIRGGICRGDILVQDGVVFGPGLVKAYTLESKYAVYPRIVIDRDLLALAGRPGSTPYWAQNVSRGDDGAYYLDYLHGTISRQLLFRDPAQSSPEAQLRAHAQMIEAVIRNNIRQKDERIRQKMMWLALYHNFTVRKLREQFGGRHEAPIFETLIIPETLLQF